LAAAGSCVYNLFLEMKDKCYVTHRDAEKPSLNYLHTHDVLVKLKKGHVWLYEVNSQSLQMSLRFLDNAFKSFLHKNTKHQKFRRRGRGRMNISPCPST